MEIGQITKAMFLCATIAGYLFLGVGTLVNAIFAWTGGRRRAPSMAREMEPPAGLARDDRRWANKWMPRNIS
jgi:hypothetical protein